MKPYHELTHAELLSQYHHLHRQYDDLRRENFNLVMARGVPSSEQLSLSGAMLTCLSETDYLSSNNIDCRNYGGIDGIPEMKELFAQILNVEKDEVIVGGNSSLNMMFDNVAANVSHGVRDGIPWQKQGKIKFICPVPGYDRHFAICNYFHIEMIPVAMNEDGPDMDQVEALVNSNPLIKGMWCVPIFSNPTGVVYSQQVVKRIANLRPAATDFRLYWDNAYCVHNFSGEIPHIPNIIKECELANNPHMPLVFASFSKISFSGAGVAAMASSKSNCDYIRSRLTIQTVGPDKLNQLRHVRFFKDLEGVLSHMKKMGELLYPKFELVLNTLDKRLAGKEIAHWNNPYGGYFISLNTLEGCAKKTVSLCKEAGLTLTPAGATFPSGKDPLDQNIRIAPSYPNLSELNKALDIFCISLELSATEKLLEQKNI